MPYIYFISRKIFDPAIATWIKEVALDGIVLVSVWLIKELYNE